MGGRSNRLLGFASPIRRPFVTENERPGALRGTDTPNEIQIAHSP